MLPREYTEQLESETLSKYASLSKNSKGRVNPESKCDFRTDYQRDRDRIIHSSSFRRLMHKTQVFLSPVSDHYRTRLTHTLEVAQIARTVARGLRLNEDLTEAIALGHDLGHTPFGHDGERRLNDLIPGGFTHSAQGTRVLQIIERSGKGLNITEEIINGIYCHSDLAADTLEGVVVKICDKIAYVNHDIEDAVRGGVLRYEELPKSAVEVLGDTKSKRISTLVASLIENSGGEIKMSPAEDKANKELRSFMFDTVYTHPKTIAERGKARDIIEFLYHYFIKHCEKIPQLYINIAQKEGIERAVGDYVAGMTDSYAVNMYSDIVIPKNWI